MTQPMEPFTPEQWLDVINTAVTDSGHGDEVLLALEVTDTWKITVNPVRTPQPTTPGQEHS
jgi:hypothetical protein